VVYVEQVHMAGGTGHEHIAEVRWRDPADNQTGRSSRADMVTYINNGNVAKVKDSSGNEIRVGVVNANPPYIRTYADGTPTDNLLYLPRY
jgi:hypothetical protein